MKWPPQRVGGRCVCGLSGAAFPAAAMLVCAPFPETLEVPEELLAALRVSFCSCLGTAPWLGLPLSIPQLGCTQGWASSRGVHRCDCPGSGSGGVATGVGKGTLLQAKAGLSRAAGGHGREAGSRPAWPRVRGTPCTELKRWECRWPGASDPEQWAGTGASKSTGPGTGHPKRRPEVRVTGCPLGP